MDQWKKSVREEKHRHGSKNPSFSSSLLDAIYRSIDEGEGGPREEELVFYRETLKKKQTSSTTSNMMRGGGAPKKSWKEEEEEEDEDEDEEMESLRRASMIEKWMEKKVSEKVVYRRKSLPDYDRKLLQNEHHDRDRDRSSFKVFHSTSSSSDSSCGGGVFSSSEAESCYGGGSRSRSSSFTSQRPKPVRTSVTAERDPPHPLPPRSNEHERKCKSKSTEGGLNKTKSKALKIYAELKKAKQPISPGGRLATFLNTLFTTGNHKKGQDLRKSKSAQASTCSSASSFSRSCLSKTPSTRGAVGVGVGVGVGVAAGGKPMRSVRFYPVSVIVDEDSRPCGHKSLQEEEPTKLLLNQQLKLQFMEKNRMIEEAARDLLKNYQNKGDLQMRHHQHHNEFDDDDEDDDAASDASSDLFELDNLAPVGIQRYREELPVYETTHFQINRAIANGFIM